MCGATVPHLLRQLLKHVETRGGGGAGMGVGREGFFQVLVDFADLLQGAQETFIGLASERLGLGLPDLELSKERLHRIQL